MDAITNKLIETLDFIRDEKYLPELYKEFNCKNKIDMITIDEIINRVDQALLAILTINRNALYYFGKYIELKNKLEDKE